MNDMRGIRFSEVPSASTLSALLNLSMRCRMEIRIQWLILGVLLGWCAAGCASAAGAGDAQPRVHVYQSAESGIFANAYLVETAHGIVAIDTTLTNSDSNALLAKLAALHKPLLA